MNIPGGSRTTPAKRLPHNSNRLRVRRKPQVRGLAYQVLSLGAVVGATRFEGSKARKVFFFEKKKQKTFDYIELKVGVSANGAISSS